MSNSNGPVRRRRIAGESTPSAPPAEKRSIVPKPAKKKTADKTPVAKESAKKGQSSKPPVTKAPPVKAPFKKVASAPAANANATLIDNAVTDAPRAPKPYAEPKPAKERAPRDKVGVPSGATLLRLLPFIILAVAALVFGGWSVASGVSDVRAQRGIDAAHAKATTAASQAAETVFTYQYNKLDDHLKASKKLMTPTFQKEFDSIAPALNDLAPQRKIVVLSKTRDAAPVECGSSCSKNKASVLVFLDQARLVGDSTKPTVFGNRIVIDMVKSHGKWLVSNILAL